MSPAKEALTANATNIQTNQGFDKTEKPQMQLCHPESGGVFDDKGDGATR
jgi:hypothetical protein